MPANRPRSPYRTWGSLLLLMAVFSSVPAVGASSARNPLSAIRFRNLGPAIAGGRVTAVAGVPGRCTTIYVGTAGGGVWKTVNSGANWTAIFTHQATSSIGALAVVPGTSSRIWVGTGESNLRSDVRSGTGLYFSADGGKHWKFMGLRHAGQIARILVDPENHKIVYVAVLGNAWRANSERGVFKTTNGGITWKQVLQVNNRTGAIDLAMAPGRPNTLFAAMWQVVRRPWTFTDGGPGSGLYETTNGGDTWHKLDHAHNGLPQGPIGRIGIAFAPSNPKRLYALIEARKGLLWTSSDAGAQWRPVTDNYALDVRPFYFSQLAVSPSDPRKVYFAAVHLMVSDDGGKHAHVLDRHVHADHHAIWIDPKNPDYIIEGTDGGVYVTRNGGRHWRYLDNLPIEQFYSVAIDKRIPFDICGGLQDNGVWCGPSSNLNGPGVNGKAWHMIFGGDGEYSVPAPTDPNIIYSDMQRGISVRYNKKTGLSHFIRPYVPGYGRGWLPARFKYRFNWTTPLAVSPLHAETIYEGANVLFKSTDGGDHWRVISPDLTRNDKARQQLTGGPINLDLSGAETYDTILSIALSPTAPSRLIWVGTDDGLVQLTRDGGKHWENVTPPQAPAWARVEHIGLSTFSPAVAFVTYDAHMLGNRHPYVYITRNYGKTWHQITKGLPSQGAAHVIREDPNHKGLLVLGTDRGLYYARHDGALWHPLTGNFPTVSVVDLQFADQTHSLVVATHGRGIFVLDNLRPLEGLSKEVLREKFHLFPASTGYLFHHNNYSGHENSTALYTVGNAPEGVQFSYYLRHSPSKSDSDAQPVTIRILGPAHRALDTITQRPRAGINETLWDLRYRHPTRLDFVSYGRANKLRGPYVLPGSYQAVATYGGKSHTETVVVRADPRLSIPATQFSDQQKTALVLWKSITKVNATLNALHAVREALHNRTQELSSATFSARHQAHAAVTQLAAAYDRLGALERMVFNPKIQHNVPEDDIHYLAKPRQKLIELYGLVLRRYGQAPNEALLAEIHSVREKLRLFMSAYKRFLSTTLPALNLRLKRLHQPPVQGAGS